MDFGVSGLKNEVLGASRTREKVVDGIGVPAILVVGSTAIGVGAREVVEDGLGFVVEVVVNNPVVVVSGMEVVVVVEVVVS